MLVSLDISEVGLSKKVPIWLFQLGQKSIFNIIKIQMYKNYYFNGCLTVS